MWSGLSHAPEDPHPKMQGYGRANREDRVPVTVDTVFKIGSVSKQFIASAIKGGMSC
jgi:beta-lactamase family protein